MVAKQSSRRKMKTLGADYGHLGMMGTAISADLERHSYVRSMLPQAWLICIRLVPSVCHVCVRQSLISCVEIYFPEQTI